MTCQNNRKTQIYLFFKLRLPDKNTDTGLPPKWKIPFLFHNDPLFNDLVNFFQHWPYEVGCRAGVSTKLQWISLFVIGGERRDTHEMRVGVLFTGPGLFMMQCRPARLRLAHHVYCSESESWWVVMATSVSLLTLGTPTMYNNVFCRGWWWWWGLGWNNKE